MLTAQWLYGISACLILALGWLLGCDDRGTGITTTTLCVVAGGEEQGRSEGQHRVRRRQQEKTYRQHRAAQNNGLLAGGTDRGQDQGLGLAGAALGLGW